MNRKTVWRRKTKQKIIDGFGGKCCRCGYNEYIGGLDLHHTNVLPKEFSISAALRKQIPWIKMVVEVKKCIMLCANCHRELHGNIWSLSDITPVAFNDTGC